MCLGGGAVDALCAAAGSTSASSIVCQMPSLDRQLNRL
jgi:hypothetical protein